MTAELTAEQIVTNLLSSNEILRRQKGNFYLTMPENLGEYLSNLPEEEIVSSDLQKTENTKYAFIKEGGWKF